MLVAVWLLLTAQTTPTPSPSTSPTPTPTATPNPATLFAQAKPYSDKEFPDWALKLRRFEIIAVGAFPIAYLFSGLGYDYAYYFSTGFPQSNIPWPAGPGTSAWTNTANHDQLQRKNYTLVAVAAGLSLLLAGVDWFLGN
jgi:hypothetical protein